MHIKFTLLSEIVCPKIFLGELNRASKVQPGSVDKEYVQWQRGATTKTPLPLMKSWIDTVVADNNDWLVLVFHGVDGVGWEALPGPLLKEYFEYIKKHEDRSWIATFGDVTKYMRERMNASVKVTKSQNRFNIELTHSLDNLMYNLPLTLKTNVPPGWKKVSVKQGAQPLPCPLSALPLAIMFFINWSQIKAQPR